ncbi:hypothetical protein [Streptomyces sp. VNUA24]|uniref:ISAzo13-like element transposase-related protein n=1 Tax=Streptomyces sp. VNUA24 TaxID=3031131 RepID=UPI0023B7C63E|nr:hypothetical protein [Streptomyces sp. VNUA24]WEH20486.1 hypothetical protein PYR72_03530 [Streptomyces sp. VNUA24]
MFSDGLLACAALVLHRDAGDPVISVDTKKKELIGEYKADSTGRRNTGFLYR